MRFSSLLFFIITIALAFFSIQQYIVGNWAKIFLGIFTWGAIILFLADKDFIIILLLIAGFFIGYIKMAFGSWVSYLIPDLLAAFAIVGWVGECITNRLPLFPQSPLTKPIVLFGAYCLLEFLNPLSPLLRSLAGFRSWILYLLLYFVGFYSLKSVRQVKKFYFLLVLLGTITAGYGIWQWYHPELIAQSGGRFTQYSEVMGWSSKRGYSVFRAWSTFVMPGTFGGNMALVMLVALSMFLSREIKLPFRLLLLPCMGLMWAGIFVSGSRGSLVILLLGIGTIWLLKGSTNIRTIVPLVLSILVAMVSIYWIGTYVMERFFTILDLKASFWKWAEPLLRGLRTAFVSPVGVGMGYTAGVPSFVDDPMLRELPTQNIDSGLGAAAAEFGLPGLAVVLYFVVKLGVESIKSWKILPSDSMKDLLIAPASYGVVNAITSVIWPLNASLPASIYIWFLIGMLMKASTLATQPVTSEEENGFTVVNHVATYEDSLNNSRVQ